jgi:hypothetical protein
MRRTVLVNVAAALLFALGAVHPAPFLMLFGFEVPACDPGSFVFAGTTPTKIIKPAGKDTIRDLKKKDVEDQISGGLTALGGNAAAAGGDIKDTVHETFKNKWDAVTYFDRTYVPDAQRRADQTVRVLTVTWKTYLVTLLAENASAMITDHETGHRLIEEKLKDLAKSKFEAVSNQIVDKVKSDAEIKAILDPVFANLNQIGDAAQKAYENATQGGTQGGADQQAQATAAFNAASQ